MERESSVWSFFTKKAEFIATCNTCNQDYSYRASTSNLRKHWYNKHRKHNIEEKPSDLSENNSDNSDEEEQVKAVPTIVNKTKSMATWKYFEPLDLEKCEGTCKICNRTVSYEYMSELKQHIEDHGHEPKDSDEEYVPDVQEKKLKRSYKSKLWEYFRVTDDKMAECLMCHNNFNYSSTITNLRRHLIRKHGETALHSQDVGSKNIIKYEGQLYEVVNYPGQEDDDDEPREIDAVYLNEEDLDDSMDIPPSPKKKQLYIPPKRKSQKISKEQVDSIRDICSEELELPRKPIPTCTPNAMGSLDYFGQYVVSLLKELPKPVSDQLQSEIIKQILTSKMALESQTAVTKYEIIRSRKNENDTKVAEPISYTVVQSDETCEKLNDITESVAKE